MDAKALFSYWTVSPLAGYGLTHKFWSIHLDTLIFTWIAMAVLFAVVFIVRQMYLHDDNLVYTAVEFCVESFANICVDSIGYFRYDYFCFITTMFLFTFTSCLVSMLPYVEEAAKDANTTFALAISSFFYVSFQQIRQEGVGKYLKHFMGPEQMPMVVRILMTPLETMGQLSRIISMAFRLFGNVLGGAVVFHVFLAVLTSYQQQFVTVVVIGGVLWLLVYRLLGVGYDTWLGRNLNIFIQGLFILTWIQMFFGVFEALIQSFVITMLSMTYLSLSVEHDLKHDTKGTAWN